MVLKPGILLAFENEYSYLIMADVMIWRPLFNEQPVTEND